MYFYLPVCKRRQTKLDQNVTIFNEISLCMSCGFELRPKSEVAMLLVELEDDLPSKKGGGW